MKNLKFLLLFIVYSNLSFSQSNENKYLMFNSLSEANYEYEIGNGKNEIRKVFIKEPKKNGDIIFYIKDKMFRYYKKANEIDSCSLKHANDITFSTLKSLETKVNDINPYYPYKVFPNLYLVEKINDSIIVKYKVKWEYYIE
jgi:hypothetical protein